MYSANGSPHDWLARWVLYISVESVERDAVRGEMDVKCIVVKELEDSWFNIASDCDRVLETSVREIHK